MTTKILLLMADTGGGHRSSAEAVLEAMRRELPKGVKVSYARGTRADDLIELLEPMQPDMEGGLVGDLKVEYFDNSDLKGKPVITAREPSIRR